MQKEFLNAGLYVRVSTEHQVREGYSISAQKENLSKFAQNQGWNICDIYSDEGISGKNIKDRPEVKRLINDIKNGSIDVVVLYKFDRLTRDSRDTEDIINLVQEFGIQVITLSGGAIDVSTASGRFMVRINGAQAQFEREQTIERVKFGFKQKVKQGYTLASAITCYGYNRKKHEKEQTINKNEAKVVKRIFQMYSDGKSFTEICDILNIEKIPTKMNGKKIKKKGMNEYYIVDSIWMPKTIRLILTNPTYIGKVRYHIGKEDYFDIEGNHKPIIQKKLWKDVQDRIKKIKHISKTNFPKEDIYYCGTLVCGDCGHKLTTNRTTRLKKDGSKVTFNNYRCINREKKICSCVGISHKKVEAAFLQYLDNIEELTEIEKIKIKNKENNKKELKILEKQITQLSLKNKEVMNLFMIDKISHEQLKYMTDEINKKKECINNEILRIKNLMSSKQSNETKEFSKNIKEHWLYLTNKEKLYFLTNFIEKIVIKNKDKIKGKPEILDVKFYER